jgi:hypothetical protein
MVLTRNQKKELVIKLYEEGKTTREIAKEVKISPRDIGIITREYNKEPEPDPPKSSRAKAIQLFSEGKDQVYVMKNLDLNYDEVKQYFSEYLSLTKTDSFIMFSEKYERFQALFIRIVERMKRSELLETDVYTLIDYLNGFRNLNKHKEQLQHEINCLLLMKKCLEDEIHDGKIPGLG